MRSSDHQSVVTSHKSQLSQLYTCDLDSMGIDFSSFGCKETLDAVQQSVGDEVIAARGLRRISHMAETAENRARLGSIGVCEAVVTIIKAHMSNHKILSLGYVSISNLALENDENRSRLGAADACEVVALSLSNSWNKNVSICLNGCCALRSLLFKNIQNRIKIGAHGVIRIVADIMRTYIQDVDIISQSIIIMANMAIDSQRNRQQLSSAGICELVVVLLNTYIEVDHVVYQALVMISRLAMEDVFRVKLGFCGACEGAVLSIRQHSTKVNVVQAGCSAIASLATFSVQHAPNDKGSKQPHAPETMRASTLSYRQQQNQLSFPNLDDDVNRERLGRSGACQVVAHVLRAHPTHQKIVLHAFDAICNLTIENDRNRSLLGALGVCQEVIWSLKEHYLIVDIARMGCSAIANLALNRENKSAICFVIDDDTEETVSAGGCEAVIQAMQSHITDEDVASQGCSSIGNLAMNNDEGAILLGICGACDVVTEALKAHPNNQAVLNFGCRAMFHLAINFECREKFLQSSAKDLLEQILSLKTTDVLRRNAANAFGMLTDSYVGNLLHDPLFSGMDVSKSSKPSIKTSIPALGTSLAHASTQNMASEDDISPRNDIDDGLKGLKETSKKKKEKKKKDKKEWKKSKELKKEKKKVDVVQVI